MLQLNNHFATHHGSALWLAIFIINSGTLWLGVFGAHACLPLRWGRVALPLMALFSVSPWCQFLFTSMPGSAHEWVGTCLLRWGGAALPVPAVLPVWPAGCMWGQALLCGLRPDVHATAGRLLRAAGSEVLLSNVDCWF